MAACTGRQLGRQLACSLAPPQLPSAHALTSSMQALFCTPRPQRTLTYALQDVLASPRTRPRARRTNTTSRVCAFPRGFCPAPKTEFTEPLMMRFPRRWSRAACARGTERGGRVRGCARARAGGRSAVGAASMLPTCWMAHLRHGMHVTHPRCTMMLGTFWAWSSANSSWLVDSRPLFTALLATAQREPPLGSASSQGAPREASDCCKKYLGR